jgi:hypothetical protein
MLVYRRILCSLALAGLALTGCAPVDPMISGRVGDNCTVYFRHDALGMAGTPAPPRADNVNGADVQLAGKLARVNAGWVCISIDKTEYTIPKESILLIEMQPKSATTNPP